MPKLESYADQYRYLHEYVALQLGVSVAGTDKQVRAVSQANMLLFASLAKTLLDKGVITDADLQLIWNVVLGITYEQPPLEPHNPTATRYNKCPNPAMANDATGWSPDTGTGSRQAVAGFDRPNVYRFTNTSFCNGPNMTVAEGEVWAISCWLQRSVGSGTDPIRIYADFYNASGTVYLASSVPTYFTVDAATPTRLSQTVTVPDSADTARLTIQVPYSPGTYDVTMALYEHVSTLEDYFDGDTPGASWDGTAGSSASTWVVA